MPEKMYNRYIQLTGASVVHATENLQLTSSRSKSFQKIINFVWLATCLPDLGHDDIAVDVAIQLWVPLDTDQAMLCKPSTDKPERDGLLTYLHRPLLWFSQWPVRPVRMILCNWLVLIHSRSPVKVYLTNAWQDNDACARLIADTTNDDVPPFSQTSTTKFHRSARNPEKNDAMLWCHRESSRETTAKLHNTSSRSQTWQRV